MGRALVERAQPSRFLLSALTGFRWKRAMVCSGEGVNCVEPQVPHYGSVGHSFPSCGSFKDGHGLSRDNPIRVSNWDSLTSEPTEAAQVPGKETARLCVSLPPEPDSPSFLT